MPATFNVRITKSAERDIEDIWSFIASDDMEEAVKFVDRLDKQLRTLRAFPERCPLIAENEILGTRYRHLVYGNYRTIFRVSGRNVYVLRVIHAARLLERLVIE